MSEGGSGEPSRCQVMADTSGRHGKRTYSPAPHFLELACSPRETRTSGPGAKTVGIRLVASAVKTTLRSSVQQRHCPHLKRNLPDRRGDALMLRGFVEILPRLKDKRTAVEMKLCGLGDPIPGACGIPTEPHPHLGPMSGS
jgi:hypothetical protein